jgi:hypothetical protein
MAGHTLNAALFERARFHDSWAIYQDDVWRDGRLTGSSCRPFSTTSRQDLCEDVLILGCL